MTSRWPRLSSPAARWTVARCGLILGTTIGLCGCDAITGQRQQNLARQRAMARQEAEAARAEAEQLRARAEELARAARAATDQNTAESGAATSRPAPDPLPAGLTPADLEEGWIALFDGATLFGWQATAAANWQVQDGTITVSSGEPGLLCTTSRWSDYVLHLDFKFAKGTNSGVFLHTALKPTDPAVDCYELNIAEPDVSPFSTGSFVKRQKAECTAAPDVWHTYEVTVQGAHQSVKLNGQVVLDYQDPQPLQRGHIGLQLNQGAVAFRNIRLKPLGLESLFNGRDLTGWTAPADQSARFEVGPEGTLHATGGKGRLESAAQYGDFILQFDGRTNAAGLNSGVFFRCVAGGELLGYESQIHNAIQNGDRAQPVDCGTGGIFRRQDARRVIADDQTWFHETLVADGPHLAVWVNGYQVTDWADTRAPDDNPRKGLRTAPGTLMLQAHDETTDIDFRALRAVELHPRGTAADKAE